MNYNIDDFRNKCDILLENAKKNGNQDVISRFERIEKFLSDDNCFVGARKVFVYFVLENLGYNDDEIKNIYNYYNGYEMFDGILEFVDDNGELIQIKTLVNPKIESYYKFVKGPVFKYNTIERDYYYLFDGKWIYDGGLQMKIDNLEYDYDLIKCIVKDDLLRRR